MNRTPLRRIGRKKPRPSPILPEHEEALDKFWADYHAMKDSGLWYEADVIRWLQELAERFDGHKRAARNHFNRLRFPLGRCIVCFEPGEDRHHLIPLGVGGPNHEKNCASLCLEHHEAVHPHLRGAP